MASGRLANIHAMPELVIRADDLSDERTRALVARHLRGMLENTPPEGIFALDIDRLKAPAVTFWSGWVGSEVAVIGALQTLDSDNGELKSMRVADAHLGAGYGRAMLTHIVAEASRRGMRRLWLETGSTSDFAAARALYASAGFMECDRFGGYPESEFSVYMTRRIART